MSEELIKAHGLLIVLCGPTGVGKRTISRMLAERPNVSYTDAVGRRKGQVRDVE